jgi:hypothetical protein
MSGFSYSGFDTAATAKTLAAVLTNRRPVAMVAGMNAPQSLDLTKQIPRSPNDDLGGFVILPRLIDKCRALLAGKVGEYKYNCPLDRLFFDFSGMDAEEFKAEVASGKTDEQLLQFVREKGEKHSESEILCWSFEMRQRGPLLADQKAYFEQLRKRYAPKHPWVSTWFALLDAEEGRLK